MGTDEFIEQVLYPAFNDRDDVAGVDPLFGGVGAATTIEVRMVDGAVFRLTVEPGQ